MSLRIRKNPTFECYRLSSWGGISAACYAFRFLHVNSPQNCSIPHLCHRYFDTSRISATTSPFAPDFIFVFPPFFVYVFKAGVVTEPRLHFFNSALLTYSNNLTGTGNAYHFSCMLFP